MKHTYKTALLACALSTVFSMHAMALEPAAAQPAPVAAQAPAAPEAPAVSAAPVNVQAEEETPASLYSNLNPEQTAEINQSKSATKALDDLNRRKDKSSVELELIKLEVEKEKARDEIRKLKGQASPAADSRPAQADSGASSGDHEEGAKAKATDSSTPLDRVFVTQIYGLEGHEVATVFYENSIIKAQSGDPIADGLRLEKVLSNGAIFSYKGKTKKALLTTKEQAFSRSFSGKSDDNDGDNNRQQAPRMARQMTPTPGA